MSGSLKWLAAAPGEALSPSRGGDPEVAARAFLEEHASLFGLAPRELAWLEVSSTVPASDGGTHVYFIQTMAGIEVFGGRAQVNLLADGAVRSASAQLYSDLGAPGRPGLDPTSATRIAVRDVYPDIVFTGTVHSIEPVADRRTVFDGTGFAFPPRARLVLFPEVEGARLAWEVRVAERTAITSYRTVVDAIDGHVLHRTNTTVYAEARVLDAERPEPTAEEFEPAQHVLLTIPSATPESPNGWISGAGTCLEGNNAVSHLGYFYEPALCELAAAYDYPFNIGESALVNAWWWANDAHDRFYALGFDEAAGNFQQNNFGAGGVGGDAADVVAYGSGRRNAAFAAFSPDGGPFTINLSWADCRFCGDHDGYPENGGERHLAFDRDAVFHEYSHGVNARRVGGPADDTCLFGLQNAALDEGWCDTFGGSFFADARFGGYVEEGSAWYRGLEHDLTYDDMCGVGDRGCEAHADGMIWAGALRELRESMRALDPETGLDKYHRILVQGLAETPCLPTMLDARDGILQADTVLYSSANHQAIWNVLAARGMGQNALSFTYLDPAPIADYTVPAAYACTAPSSPTGLAATTDGDNAIRLDYDASGAASVEVWREDLDNPFDRPARIAFTTSTATYADDSVQGGKSYRYHLVALGGGGTVCRSVPSATADATATGTCVAYPVFDPGTTVADGSSDCALTVSWSAAAAGCPGSSDPIVYNVYRATRPGFEPAERLLVGRTTGTSFQDIPPEDGVTRYYLVLAEHGTPDDPPDHGDRGGTQILRWAPGVPTLGRAGVQAWDFDSGPQGWTADVTADPSGGWTLVTPSGTPYAGTLLNPDEAAGGSGMAWVTGDGGAAATVTSHDCDAPTYLNSPEWDGTGGATILSFDYWSHLRASFGGGLDLRVDNGTDQVTVRVTDLMTAQAFETAGRHGWQRSELDLSTLVAPTTTMSVTFIPTCEDILSEFGIDNVRVENATACARPALRLESVTVDDTPAGWGNGNGLLEPGETARLEVTAANDGSTTAFSPSGRLSILVPDVLVHEETDSFPDIAPSGSGTSAGDGFTVTVPDQVDCSRSLVFDFEFTDASGTASYSTWNAELGYAVTETVFEDDFETDLGWTASGAGAGQGRWERGDPVGTTNGSDPANPENDSPNDPGLQCYVTENASGGVANGDVDPGANPELLSPLIDLSGYERARLRFDLWYYDDSAAPDEDLGETRTWIENGRSRPESRWLDNVHAWQHLLPTAGWEPVDLDLTPHLPMTSNVRVRFRATDSSTDDVVEMGVDYLRVLGDLGVCDATGVSDPPNGVGDTLRVDKGNGTLTIRWSASAVDPTHDGAAYYRLYASGAPDSGFTVAETATTTSITRPLDDLTEYFKIVAVNPAGTSGDEPKP